MRRLLHIILLMNLVFPQGLLPGTYKMAAIDFDTTSFKGLKSNSISDIVPLADTLVWLGTGAGLAVLRDTSSIFTITSNASAAAGQLSNETPAGGVTALAASQKTLFAAFATTIQDTTFGNEKKMLK